MATLQKLENRIYEPHAWETVPCPVCGSTRKTLWERYGDRWQYTHNLCSDCKLVYCSPRPKYDKTFLHEAYEFYMDDSTAYSDDYQKKADDHYPNLVADLKEMRQFDVSGESFLDVGCETGTILWQAANYFKKISGVEVSKKMAAFASKQLKCQVHTTPFEKLSTREKYSCIHMSHVIEHYPNPHLWLQKAKSLLTPGGIIVIKVPNMFSPDRRFKVFLKRIGLRKGKWEPWRTPDHLFEPTMPSMLRLFAMNGLKVRLAYTYSRKNLVSDTLWQRFIYRKLGIGNNLKFILQA
jgi:2-polyprenyl-3-methyl-5-hydroxy-6-metoxy-1,4-benzoquinol methylase